MQTARRPHTVSPLAIVLPHPPLPTRRSSLLSTTSAISSPRTPRSCGSPSVASILFTNPKRNSTDSWNSSNPPDDLDVEWKQEDVSLLSRTLDALPAHLVTPFIGPIPPNNLLDKLARGVSQAKGPADWPYSIRATRVKLLELARLRAKEDAAPRVLRIAEEPADDVPDSGVLSNDNNYSYYSTYGTPRITSTNTTNGVKKPLYRQSSMDFMMGAELTLTSKENSTRLASRLHRVDRQVPTQGFHPYSRTQRSGPRRSPSPSLPSTTAIPHAMNPSTPSSSTLNSVTSISARPMHRSSSSLTLSSRTSEDSYLLPTVSRTKAKPLDAIPPPLPPKDKTSLRYGTTVTSKRKPVRSGDSPRLMSAFGTTDQKEGNVTYPSSDEEEKLRNKTVKRLRGKHGTAIKASPQSSTSESSTSPPPDGNATSPTKTRKTSRPVDQDDQRRNPSTRRNVVPMNVHRNPSILGPELPKTKPTSPKPQQTPSARSPLPLETPASPPPSSSPATSVAATPATIDTLKHKTLRRVKRMPPARRISFGSIQPKSSQEDFANAATTDVSLGSAFQLS